MGYNRITRDRLRGHGDGDECRHFASGGDGDFHRRDDSNSGYAVWWASEGRSDESRARAEQHHLNDAADLASLCARCEGIVSVCPPHAAEATADAVLAAGFRGTYIDANAIAPQRARRIGAKMDAAGATFVDGGIIGGPAWKPGATWLYLSGDAAAGRLRAISRRDRWKPR